jgi:hypothetical protein
MEKLEFHFSRNVIKVRLGDEIRRVPILTDELTYNELCSLILRLFKSQITEIDKVKLKYFDEDGDLVVLDDDWDIKYALSLPKGLHLVVSEGLPILQRVMPQEQQRLLKDLKELKSKIDNLLSSVQENHGCPPINEPPAAEKEHGLKPLSTKEVLEILDLPPREAETKKEEKAPIKKAAEKELAPSALLPQSLAEDAKKATRTASSPKASPSAPQSGTHYAPSAAAYPFYPASHAPSNHFVDQYGQQYTVVNGQYVLNPNASVHQGYYQQTGYQQQPSK